MSVCVFIIIWITLALKAGQAALFRMLTERTRVQESIGGDVKNSKIFA